MKMHSTRRRERLWAPIVAPVIWSTHFTVCYIWVAMACGRFGSFDRARTGVAILTAAAVAAIATCLWYGLRQHGYRLPDRPNDDGTPEDRTRFMAFTTMLLAALSLLGTLYVGVAVGAVGGCR
jgi:hypothetical protein